MGVSVQGVSVQGGLCPEGLCPGGSLSRGSLAGILCPGWCLSRRVFVQGVSVQGVSGWGSLSRVVCVQEALCPGGSLSRGPFQGDFQDHSTPTI